MPLSESLHLGLRGEQIRLQNVTVLPAQPYRFFDVIWQEFMDKGQGVLLGAFEPGGRFMAGKVYLFCGQRCYYKFNTSSLSAPPSSSL